MKSSAPLRTFLVFAAIGLFAISAANLAAQTPSPTPAQAVSDLSWLAGDWQTAPNGHSQTDEHWTQPAGGSLMGLSRTVAGGRTHDFEYLRIEQRPEGIFYVAHPKARCPATDFKMTRLTATEVVFENPAHDFPKRISYRKADDGSLVATVDAGPGSKGFTFSYQPMKK
jgi:hypothetical protein